MKSTLFLFFVLFKSITLLATPIWQEGSSNRGLNPEGVVRLNDFARLAKTLSPTVVNIQVTMERRLTRRSHPFANDPMFPFFDHYFQQPRTFKNRGIGSGVVISPDGYILTNHHVIEGATKIEVNFLDDESLYPAKVIGKDPKTDLALLKVDIDQKLPFAPLGDSDRLNIGEWVLAIGNPFGLDHTVTAGIVSAKGRKEVNPGNRTGYYNFIQTDASINPGNSGGPLFNIHGEVVGINTAINASGQGIGFAIPINMVKLVMKQLIKHGSVKRAWIGVSIQKVSRELAASFGRKNSHGALVTAVVPGSPAEEAQLQNGDIILKFDGKAIRSANDLPWMVSMSGIGEGKKMVVLRDGITRVVTITPALYGEQNNIARSGATQDDQMKRLGIAVRDVDNGVMITDLKRGGLGYELGLQPRDIILKVNRQEIKTAVDLIAAISRIKKGEILRLYIRRGEGHLFVAVRF